MRISKEQHASILRVSAVLLRAACSSLRPSVRTLKAAKLSKYLGLNNASTLLLVLLVMLPPDKFIDPQYLVASFVVPISEEPGLVRFPIREGTGVIWANSIWWLSSLQRGFSLGIPTEVLDSQVSATRQ